MEKVKTIVPTEKFVNGNLRTIQDEIDKKDYHFLREDPKPRIIAYNINEYLGTIYNIGEASDAKDKIKGRFRVYFDSEKIELLVMSEKIKALSSIVLKETVKIFNNKRELKKRLKDSD